MRPLSEVLDSYILAHDLEPSSRAQLRWTLRRFERWLERAGTLLDLEDDRLNRWILAMQDSGLSRITVRGQRGNLLTLWRYACEDLGYDLWPRRVRRVKAPLPIPVAWCECQLRALLVEADKQPGRFGRSRVCRSAFWRALILVLYYSALRLGDALRLTRANIGSDGKLVVEQRKTGWPIVCRLPPEALAAAGRLSGRIDVVFCGPESDAAARAFMQRLARAGCGSAVHHDWRSPALAAPIRKLLALPPPR